MSGSRSSFRPKPGSSRSFPSARPCTPDDPASPSTPYLSRYAEPEARAADALAGDFGHVLVIPAYGEGQSLFDALGSVPQGPAGDTLIVVVLNARADSPAAGPRGERGRPPAARRGRDGARRELAASPPDRRAFRWLTESSSSSIAPPPGHFLPEGQGVGLARKIGNDFALALHAARPDRLALDPQHGRRRHPPQRLLRPDRDAARIEPGNAAAVYFFEHRFAEDADLAEAARLYEISLRYYTLGLAWAGSPYAYEAMGSCIAVRPAAYAAVRGFPKKNAAEDFYFLNKLAKVGAIERLAGAPLLLDGRVSDRVPFGTGRALGDLVTKPRARSGFRLYHPVVFAHVAAWLSVLERTRALRGSRRSRRGGAPPRQSVLPRRAFSWRRSSGWAPSRPCARRSSARPAIRRRCCRHFHAWFDAFRTRKLVHALRDGGLPSPGYREALAEAPFTGLSASTEEEPELLRQALAAEERKLAAAPAGWNAEDARPN